MLTPGKFRSCSLVLICLVLASSLVVAQQQLGSVIGQLRVARADFPPENVLVSLEFRGSQIQSTYTDAEGKFGFYNLIPNAYEISIHDDHYEMVHQAATINPLSSGMTLVNVTLVPITDRNNPGAPGKLTGANPNVTDVREYSAHFPKSAVKEFEKGVASDNSGNKDAAIHHYQKALEIAPDFYAAHNNLGSSYLSKSELQAARKEFEQVVRLNQSDANAYFNLSNVCLLSHDLPEAQRFLGEGLRREPESALGHFILGSFKFQSGKLPEAETALRQTIKLNPLMVQARLQLVNVLVKQGRKSDAVAELQDFIGSFPGNSFVPRAKQLLRSLQASPPAAHTH